MEIVHMRRVISTELLDEDRGSPTEIARSLDDLWRINRWLGGASGCLRLLERALSANDRRTARILDVGAGDGRLAAFLKAKLARRNIRADFVVLDRRISHLGCGFPFIAGISPLAGDALALPFRPASFDVVMCNLFLHHFSGECARDLLRRLAATANIAVVVNDLERRVLPWLFIRCALPFARSRITRHDGPASVRQAYTRGELLALARAAGLSNLQVERLTPYRLGVILWK